MAKSLNTLIRIREWNVDEKRRELGSKLNTLGLLEKKSLELKMELQREQKCVMLSPELFGFSYENYGAEVIRKQEKIDQDILAINSEIRELRSKLYDAYCELKKFDVIARKRAAQADKETKQKEQIIRDDLGIIGFLNKRSR